ncbi:hypothetical protein BGX38DRAFT_92865 [Terfezia claveryi]|nr:hypothetical protein BGX38DRAFT_92865 [Terfezia claveryi]
MCPFNHIRTQQILHFLRIHTITQSSTQSSYPLHVCPHPACPCNPHILHMYVRIQPVRAILISFTCMSTSSLASGLSFNSVYSPCPSYCRWIPIQRLVYLIQDLASLCEGVPPLYTPSSCRDPSNSSAALLPHTTPVCLSRPRPCPRPSLFP